MLVRIDLIRHGQAAPAGAGGDAARPLSPAGVSAIRALGERLRGTGWRPERALTSPLARARETAALVTAAAGLALAIEISVHLEPERGVADSAAALGAELEPARHVLLVGHQPLLGALVEHWTGVAAALSPGELVALEFERLPGPRAGRIVERSTAGS